MDTQKISNLTYSEVYLFHYHLNEIKCTYFKFLFPPVFINISACYNCKQHTNQSFFSPLKVSWSHFPSNPHPWTQCQIITHLLSFFMNLIRFSSLSFIEAESNHTDSYSLWMKPHERTLWYSTRTTFKTYYPMFTLAAHILHIYPIGSLLVWRNVIHFHILLCVLQFIY